MKTADMNALENRNKKIIEAVLQKEKTMCPGAVALIGIYGSFQTGDIHSLSDLDLLILINDDRGRKLETAFIQDDLDVGHDIYCTSWESLRQDACYTHPHISKLMDSQIVYCADERYRRELEELRDQVRKTLSEPFGKAHYQKAGNEFKAAQCCYAAAMIEEEISTVLRHAGGMIYYTENAVALLNRKYFRKGVKDRYEELNAMEIRPENLCSMIEDVLKAADVQCIKDKLTLLMKEVTVCFQKAKRLLPLEKKPASSETLSGTYEEMYSNWHGKMATAAESGDRYLAFMSLESLNEMLADISSEVDIGSYDALSVYDPEDLRKTASGFESILKIYLTEYERAGLKANRFSDIDDFIYAYLRPETD